MQDSASKRSSWKTFTKEQKAAFGLFVFLAFFALLFGWKTFSVHIQRPFELQALRATTQTDFLETSSSKEEEKLKATDTDQDGLMDYDELYVYKTSPYLSDSDSDSYDDKTEVFSGNDPNCPIEKDCKHAIVSENTSQEAAAQEFLEDSSGIVLSLEEPTVNGVSPEALGDMETLLSAFGVEEIQELLKEQGVPQETLDSLDDETLLKLFEQAFSEAVGAEGEKASSE